MTGMAVATTFNPATLAVWRDVNPDIPCGAILLGDPFEVDLSEYGPVSAVGVHHECLSERFVEAMRAEGLAVFAWTVNEVDRARDLLAAGATGVITDDPRDMVRALSGAPRSRV